MTDYTGNIRKLMLLNEYDDMILARVACECSDSDHDAELMFTNDDGFLELLIIVHSHKKYHSNFFSKWFFRAKDALTLFIKGDTLSFNEIVLSKENLVAFEKAIKLAKRKLESNKL
jgi:hypothetical protein